MAFSATVISPMKQPERISRSLGVYAGKVSIASYTAAAVLTAVTKYFVPTGNATTGGFAHGICSVQIDGPSSGGYVVAWDYATGCFKAYSPTAGGIVCNSALAGALISFGSGGTVGVVHATSAVGTILTATASEAAENSAVGTFGFVAIGFVR